MKFESPHEIFTPEKDVVHELSIVIPVYNGSGLLEKHVTPFLAFLGRQHYKTQVIMVDDGSSDRLLTQEYARKKGLVFSGFSTNKGKGAALRRGFELANASIQLFTDADIPFQYHNIGTIVSLLRQDPGRLIIGDRTDSLSVYFENIGLLRNLGSHIVSGLVNIFFIKGVRDTQCGLKGMGKTVAQKLFGKSSINRFAIDIELIYLADKNNIPVLKIPVQLRYNEKSSVNTLKDGLKLLQDLYRIRKIHGKENSGRRTGDKISIRGDYQFNAYFNGNPLQRFWHRFKISTAIENLQIRQGMQLLDAGCGSGVLSSLIARINPSIKITGLDGNADAIHFCKQQWRDLPNINFLEGPIDRLNQFEDEEMDGIAFLEVIEHITANQSVFVLGEFYRILKRGGLLVVSTPNRRSLWPVQEGVIDMLHLAPKMKSEQHEKLYSGNELGKIAEQIGFGIHKKQSINFIAPWIAVISGKYAKKAHSWEIKQNWIPGSLLMYTLIKR